MPYDSDMPRHYYRVPGRFIADCVESGVDIGFYDDGPGLLIDPTHDQLRELRNRAEYYAHPNGPDQLPPGLKTAARALLKRLDTLGLGR